MTSFTTSQTLQKSPSLRHFATDHLDEHLIPDPILCHLTSISIGIESWNRMEDRRSKGRLGSAAILYRCDLYRLADSLAARSVEHLRVTINVDDFRVLPFSNAEMILEEWCQRLTNAEPPYPLKSLYLPFLTRTTITYHLSFHLYCKPLSKDWYRPAKCSASKLSWRSLATIPTSIPSSRQSLSDGQRTELWRCKGIREGRKK